MANRKDMRMITGLITASYRITPNPAYDSGAKNIKIRLRLRDGRSFNIHRIEQIPVYQDTSAVLANNDLFPLPYLALALRGNGVKTTAAGVAFYGNY